MTARSGNLEALGSLGLWSLLALACGGEPAAQSTVTSEAGAGGAGGTSSLVLGVAGEAGGGTGGTGAGGGGSPATGGTASAGAAPAPTIQLHTCPAEPDPACPASALPGDVTVSDAAAMAALAGVTSIEGTLRIREGQGMDALSCLQEVGDNLELDLFAEDGDVSLWGLRNLRTVGGSIDLSPGLERVYPDCGLSRVESLGARYLTGGAVDSNGDLAGELDLSSLREVRHVRIRSSLLSRVVLPSNVTLSMGQLLFEDNPYLAEVAGFSAVTIQSRSVGGTYSVRIVDNPSLSECRASELAQLFIAGGSPAASVTVMGNAPCVP